MNEIHQIKPFDATEMAAAVARWEGEGGSLMPRPEVSSSVSALTGLERRVLEHLGVAVVKEWNVLPTAIQRALFTNATASTGDPAQLKALIARFLHQHKDASASMTVKT
ncbi:hypothetical protein ACI7BZ_11565 [Xanthobacter sp. AM11]|uniref:hypothetical protein n=1 Tax=Xanthobacter sp. AM11 TaxID=3380643 RepID=UPI0039BF2CCB